MNCDINISFILLTCDGIHVLLRCRGVARDPTDWRERDVGVQVQAQHEIMNLVRSVRERKRGRL